MRHVVLIALVLGVFPRGLAAEVVEVEGQPLGANLLRLSNAMEVLGTPLPRKLRADLAEAAEARDARRLQELIDPRVLAVVRINPEERVKVERARISSRGDGR